MGHTIQPRNTETSKELQFRRRRKNDYSKFFTVWAVAMQTSYHVLSMRRKTKELNRRSGKTKAEATLEEGLAQLGALIQLEIVPPRLRGNHHGYSADEQLFGKARKHWKEAVQHGLKREMQQARWDQDQIYPNQSAKLRKNKARRGVVLWDDIAVNEDTSNDPRYSRTVAEIYALCLERFKDRKYRQIWTSHKGTQEPRVFACITPRQGVEAVSKRNTNVILLKFLGVKHLTVRMRPTEQASLFSRLCRIVQGPRGARRLSPLDECRHTHRNTKHAFTHHSKLGDTSSFHPETLALQSNLSRFRTGQEMWLR